MIKILFFGIVIGLVCGLWFGVNVGKDRPIFSNPFVESTLSETIKEKTSDAMERAGQGIERLGEGMKGEQK